jgi:transposase
MAKYKGYNYKQMLMLPVSLEEQLMPGTIEFTINLLVDEKIDISEIEKRYKNDETRRPAIDPRILLKVVLLGYSRGILSSRKIEKACRENVIFISISCGQVMDHSTISSFISSMKSEVVRIFRDILLVCEEMDLLGGTEFSLDGCKMRSNASKEWSGTFSELRNKQEKLEKKLSEMIKEHEQEDEREEKAEGKFIEVGKRKQEKIKELMRNVEKIDRFLRENEPKRGKEKEELKSNITDNESCKMQTSHGVIQGYNGQALVDSKNQVILYAEAFGKGQDYDHLEPMLKGAKENIESIGESEEYFEGKVLSCDSNYHSLVNLGIAREEEIDAYIPDVDFRKRDERFKGQVKYKPEGKRKFRLEDYRYEKEEDKYVCPGGKELRLKSKATRMRGNIYRNYISKEEDCRGCELKKICLRGEKYKSLYVNVGEDGENLSIKMKRKIDTKEGKEIYNRRIGIIEPVFGNIRWNKRMDHFTLRGKQKVNVQWIFYCMVHNIEKIANYGFN